MTGTHRELALDLVRAALAAVDPEAAVRRALTCCAAPGPIAPAGAAGLLAGGSPAASRAALEACAAVKDASRVLVVGAGKACAGMARAAEELLGQRLSGGLVVAKSGQIAGPLPHRIEVCEAGHPLPDVAGLRATARLLALLDGLTAKDLVLVLLSGGGSSLLCQPVAGVSLEDLIATNDLLLASGVPIGGVNAVRKHLSRVTGGQLAARAAPARVVSLILSDVVGSPLDVIASGPTAPDRSTYAEALEVLGRHGDPARLPPAVLSHLRAGAAGARPETPKPDAPLFARVCNVVIASNEAAAEAAARRARELGMASTILSTSIEGEARQVGPLLAAILREVATRGRPLSRPACLVAGGETTVTLRRDPGKGGRNQELALAAALALDGLADVLLVALATDGNDGPTDAGGAIADGTTVARAAVLGLDARQHLDRNDAYPFFKALDDLLRIGPTGTNVNDLTLLLAL